MAGPMMEMRMADMEAFWKKRLNSGDAPEPKRVFVPVKEMYLTGSVSTDHRYDRENRWREAFCKHRCIACGKAFWSQEASFDCHPEATAYIVWHEFAHRGSVGAMSLEDSIRLASAAIHSGSFTSGPFI